jgi:hypothetical protein
VITPIEEAALGISATSVRAGSSPNVSPGTRGDAGREWERGKKRGKDVMRMLGAQEDWSSSNWCWRRRTPTWVPSRVPTIEADHHVIEHCFPCALAMRPRPASRSPGLISMGTPLRLLALPIRLKALAQLDVNSVCCTHPRRRWVCGCLRVAVACDRRRRSKRRATVIIALPRLYDGGQKLDGIRCASTRRACVNERQAGRIRGSSCEHILGKPIGDGYGSEASALMTWYT